MFSASFPPEAYRVNPIRLFNVIINVFTCKCNRLNGPIFRELTLHDFSPARTA